MISIHTSTNWCMKFTQPPRGLPCSRAEAVAQPSPSSAPAGGPRPSTALTVPRQYKPCRCGKSEGQHCFLLCRTFFLLHLTDALGSLLASLLPAAPPSLRLHLLPWAHSLHPSPLLAPPSSPPRRATPPASPAAWSQPPRAASS